MLGSVSSLLIVFITVWYVLGSLKKIAAVRLLSGIAELRSPESARVSKWTAVAALAAGGLLIVPATVVESLHSAPVFFASSGLFLISMLSFCSHMLRSGSRKRLSFSALNNLGMAARNLKLYPGRSMLCITLVACASFLIVAVGANRKDYSSGTLDKTSGTGGYSLVGKSSIPLLQRLDSRQGLIDLGFDDTQIQFLNTAAIYPMRMLPGEDASCLNLYKPSQPSILALPSPVIQRGGFTFQSTTSTAGGNPWLLLDQDLGAGVIPAVGDANSVQWILHSGLGQDLSFENDYGDTIKLRLVGLLQSSIFQSEILVSEKHFIANFPSQSGFNYSLISAAHADTVGAILESTLEDYGFDVIATGGMLDRFQSVENTYLSVFQTLGGLGLLLGTVGLGIVLMRNTAVRRGELAILIACGFRKRTIARILILENTILVLLGLLVGSGTAIVSVIPLFSAGLISVPWTSLGVILFAVFTFGVLSSALFVSIALRASLLPALRSN